MEAALWNLDRWVRSGQAPATAAPIKLTEGRMDRSANGEAEGGVRTPWVDVPIARLSGTGNSGGVLGPLVGVGEPFDSATLKRLYPDGPRDYVGKFNASLAAAIHQGFILQADRTEIESVAAVTYPASIGN